MRIRGGILTLRQLLKTEETHTSDTHPRALSSSKARRCLCVKLKCLRLFCPRSVFLTSSRRCSSSGCPTAESSRLSELHTRTLRQETPLQPRHRADRIGRLRMWIWYFLLGSGSVDCQVSPGGNSSWHCSAPGSFMCADGECVPAAGQCDGYPDCADRSDERGCLKLKSKCASTFFSCANGVHCIIGRFQCNGFRDCPDGSDEDNCTAHPLLCSSLRFHCANGRCVDRSFLCNGQDNCQDNSDEENCLTTAESPEHMLGTLDYRLRYYPSITYAVIGSAIIFVLVVALLALVLHHQRKRSVLLPQRVYRGSCHQPLLLSRLLIVERGHLLHPSRCPGAPADLPPSYSQAVRDSGRPVWFDLPPPPYPPPDREPPGYEEPEEPAEAQTQTSVTSVEETPPAPPSPALPSSSSPPAPV